MLFESSAGHFPGFVNAIPGYQYPNAAGNPVLNWCEVVLPQIGREDLWAGNGGTTGFRTGNFSSVTLSPFVCPDDSNASAIAAPLTYIVNSNICGNRLLSLSGSVVDVMVSQLKKPTRTLLLGEGPMPPPPSPPLPVLPPQPPSSPDFTRQWNWSDTKKLYADYAPTPTYCPPLNMTFTWSPGSSLVHLSSLTQLFVNPPYHPSVYIATFCDGHAETLLTDADCSTISTRVDGAMP